ncbi:hypothetical protein MKX01_009574, partial [Papaver californicum]
MEVVSGGGGISATRGGGGGGSLPMPPSSSTSQLSSPRKEWRAVSDSHSPLRNPNNNEEFERSKLGQQQSDHERTLLYE